MNLMNAFSWLAKEYEYNSSISWRSKLETYFTWCTGDTCSIQELVRLFFNWLAIGVGVVVVIFVVVGAIQYITAAGNQEQAKKAIERIRNAVLALGLYLIMWALMNFIIPGGVFTAT
jgi:heme exporter protein D